MGGGGGSGRMSIGDIEALENAARKELERSQASERRNVFLSFAYEDIQKVNLLRAQAKKPDSDLEFNDWSVREPFNSDRADYIRKKISERIEHSSATAVFISDETSKSKWVNWEIKKSAELGKKVIAIYQQGAKPKKLPSELKKLGVKPIPWSHEKIIKALK